MSIWIKLILVTVILGMIGATGRFLYKTGYDARDAEVMREIVEAVEQARKDEAENWKQTVADAEATIVVEEKIVETVRVVEKEIPTVVEKIVEVKPECRNLGNDYARVRNNQIRAANSREITAIAAELVEGMPGTQ